MSGHGGHGGRGRRGGHEEEHAPHENEERWLLTYSDMITLLMVLFIVMFAISQVDQKKFMALKTGLAAGFGAPVTMVDGGDGLLNPGGQVDPNDVNLSGSAGGGARQNIKDPSQAVTPSTVAQLAQAMSKAQVAAQVKSLQQAEAALKAALHKAGLTTSATFRFDERGLVITIATDDVLFSSASAELRPRGRHVLDALAPTLRRLPNRLSIDGHTNQLPLRAGSRWSSDWELSAARATNVLIYLNRLGGIPENRMSATAYADTEPLIPPSDPRSVNRNRRVEIVVLAETDDSLGRAVEALGNETSTATPRATTTTPAASRKTTKPATSAVASGTPTRTSTTGKGKAPRTTPSHH